ncbi:MAG: FHA domain-containing protein [Tepidisphaera sp.]
MDVLSPGGDGGTSPPEITETLLTSPTDLTIVTTTPAGRGEATLGPFSTFVEATLGRGEDAHIFVNDPAVSRVHARLYRRGHELLVENLSKASGTMVDGRIIALAVPLTPGHRITLGDSIVEVYWPSRDMSAATPTPPPNVHLDTTVLPTARGLGGRTPPAPLPAIEMTILGRRSNSQAGEADSDAPHTRPTAAVLDIPLQGASMVLGRDPSCEISLVDDLMISRRHALFSRMGGGWAVRDQGSSNGTFLNGERITKAAALEPGDLVSIGPYQFTFTGDALTTRPPEAGASIEARGVAVPGRGKDLVLRDVSFSIESGELVALLGISGSGKTRLMHGMCGRAPLAAGQVSYDGRDFTVNQEAMRRSIGYVPSWLTLHDSLTVADGLRFASRLRLSTDASDDEIEANIDRVLEQLRIKERKHASMKTLSDGQKRRVGLAVELLGSPQVMLLDEVTTALDLPTHCQFMKLFRDLADGGKSLLLISHHLEDLEMCDKWLYLIGGRVAFFGTPARFLTHFKVKSLREQLEVQAGSSKSADLWAKEFEQAFGGPPPALSSGGQPDSRPAAADAPPSQRRKEIVRQGKLLTHRYVTLLKSDRKNLAIMLGLAPVIACLMLLLNSALQTTVDKAKDAAMQFPKDQGRLDIWRQTELGQSKTIAFMLVTSTIIVGTFMSVREIVKETDILRHERFSSLDYVSYLLSKAGPLSMLAVASAVGMTLLLRVFGGVDALDVPFGSLAAMTSALAVSSVMLGLLISAAVDTSEKAFMVLAPILIMQLTLGGGLVEIKGAKIEPLAKIAVTAYWPYSGTVDQVRPFDAPGHPYSTAVAQKDKKDLKPPGEPWGFAFTATLLQGLAYLMGTYVLLVRRDGRPLLASLKREAKTIGLLGNAPK